MSRCILIQSTISWLAIAWLGCLAGCQNAEMPREDYQAGAVEVVGDLGVRIAGHAPEKIDAGNSAISTLTRADAIGRAVLHDPRLQAALAHVRAVEADALQARLFPNPILSVSVRLREAGGDPIIDAALAGDLMALLWRPQKISAADARLRAAAAEVLVTLAEVVSDVEESYVNVQALTYQLAALDQRQKLAERLVGLGRARLKAGESGSLDVMTLESQRMALDVDAAEKQQDLVEARFTLARLIGEPSAHADWALSPFAVPAPARSAESMWIAAALASRAEMKAKAWELAALGDELAIARLSIFEGGDIGVQSEQDQTWSVGPAIAVPLPIFDWGQARSAKARAELLAARHQMTQLQRQIVQDVRTQYSTYNATLKTLRMARDELLPLQERRAAQAEASYKAGEADITNLLLAEEDLLESRVKVVELQKKTALARVKLSRAAGGLGVAARVESASTRPATVPATMPASNPAARP